MRPLYVPRKEETQLADGRLGALVLFFLKGLGARHEVVCAFSALEANDPWEKPVVCRYQLNEVVVLAQGARGTPLAHGTTSPRPVACAPLQ